MYQRTVKLYKGIDNIIKFVFKNSDQQRVNVDGWDIYFNIISEEEGSLIVTKQATVVGDPIKGEVTVMVSELDLLDLEHEFYAYSISIYDPDTMVEQVIYTDDNYTARGEIQLLGGHYPLFRKSIKVQIPSTSSNTTITSSTVTADTPTRQQSSHHTAQFYFTDFTGNVTIQTTLDALPPNGNTSANTTVSWATISSLSFADMNGTSYTNFDGVYSASRFLIDTVPSTSGNLGTVDKILYRS